MRFRGTPKLVLSALVVLSFCNSSALAQHTSAAAAIHPAVGAGAHEEKGADPPRQEGPPVSLKYLIEQALERNPEITAMARTFDMMRARIPQAKALPEPMLEVGYMGNIVPIPPFDIQKGDPSSARMVSFTQELPFPGKLALKSQMASSEAESEWWKYEQTRLNVIAEVKDAYYDLFYLTKAIETVTKNKELLDKFAKIAEAKYAVGKGIQQDVLKARVEISKLIEQSTVLEQRKDAVTARLNSLLYRDPEFPIGRPEEIKPQSLQQTLAELNELALARDPTLKMQRRRIDREQLGIRLAEKDFYPDFSVRFTYQNRPEMPEMYGISVGVRLPLYFWQKQRPAVAEAVASKAAEQKRLENLTTILFFKLKDKYLAATTGERLVSLYGTTIIPQSSLSLESAIAGYEVGKVDFLTLLDNIVTLLNYELNYYEQLSNVEKAVAAMEPLVGGSLRP
jgi:cobalt-zinc-cadmium efflux system outer membrane protein